MPRINSLEDIHLFGDYLIDAVLGQGAMSTVFLAYHRPSGEQRVLKILRHEHVNNPKMVLRFTHEGLVLSQLHRHPNIVQLVEQGEINGRHYLAFDYVPGATLRQVISAYKQIPDRCVVDIGVQAADALAYGQIIDLIHCDVKPENIWVGQNWDVRIFDFGFSRYPLRYYGGPLEAQETPGRVLGTINYMAPEQLQGFANLDGRVDIYALGVCLFEALTGYVPYHANSIEEMTQFHAEHTALTLSELLPKPHPQLSRVLNHALQLDRDQRWPTMAHFAQALRGLQQQQ